MLASEEILQQILLLRMLLMAICRMNSSPFQTSSLVWIIISLSSGKANGMNIPKTNCTRFYQNWLTAFDLVVWTRREETALSPLHMILATRIHVTHFLLKGEEPPVVKKPFQLNIFCFFVRIWLISLSEKITLMLIIADIRENNLTLMLINWRCCSKMSSSDIIFNLSKEINIVYNYKLLIMIPNLRSFLKHLNCLLG